MWEFVAKAKIDKKYKILFIVLVILVFFVFGIINGIIVDRQKITYDFLVEFADKNNKDLPVIVNSDLRYDSTMALKHNKFAFYYTFYEHSLEDFNINDFENNLKPIILEYAKETVQQNVFFKDLKINMIFVFVDKDGNNIKDIEINYKDY